MRKQTNPDSLTKFCAIPGCERGVKTRRGSNNSSYCAMHRSRVEAYGLAGHATVKRPGREIGWTCKGTVDCNGYLRTWFYGVETYVHRLVYLIENGDLPPTGFHIHHKDGNKLNNHPSNLEALSESEHHKLHGRTK